MKYVMKDDGIYRISFGNGKCYLENNIQEELMISKRDLIELERMGIIKLLARNPNKRLEKD